MKAVRVVALLICLLGGCCLPVQADLTSALREKLPSLKGKARLQALSKLQELSSAKSDPDYQIRCMNDLIAEADLQHEGELFAKAIAGRAVLYYNYDFSDSIFTHVPHDLDRLKGYKQWNRMYEVWTILVNTYIFSQQYNTALREVQSMFDDARARNHDYGMGMAYYTMGNVYSNMRNWEESSSSYRKGLDLLTTIKPTPSAVAELYSYYGDALNEKGDYKELKALTVEWKPFLEKFIDERKVDAGSANVLWSYYYLACAQAALGQHQLDEAETMLDEMRKVVRQETDYSGMSWLLYSAQLCLQRGQYQQALDFNNRRVALMEQQEDAAVYLEVMGQRAEILKHLRRYEEASDIYASMIHTKDSVSGAETSNQLNEMNTIFQVDELKMEQARTQFRNTIIIAGIIVLALVIFTVFRIRAARRLKKAHDELLVAYDQLEETTTAKERIESDLRIARNIQMGMVPSTFPERSDLDLYASMTPAKEVGGDLYGYLMAGDKLYFALGDVSGKGVPASLFMAQATRLFRTLASQGMMPADICNHLNEALSGEDNETGMFVTMFIGLVDLTTGHLDFCNAGHNPPVLLTNGKSEFIEMVPNAPIGLWPGLEYEGEEIADITNRPLFVYTDGLNEAENRQQEQFTDERLLELLETTPFESSRQTIELLKSEVEKHRDGADPNDDLTMLCVKVIRDNHQ